MVVRLPRESIRSISIETFLNRLVDLFLSFIWKADGKDARPAHLIFHTEQWAAIKKDFPLCVCVFGRERESEREPGAVGDQKNGRNCCCRPF